MTRFARQIILREIGPSGQAALEASSLELPGGLQPLAREVASAYARGAGLDVGTGSGAPERAAWFPRLQNESADQVAEGALFALDAIHAALARRPRTEREADHS